MPSNGYFDTVFAVSGDVSTVPDATDPSGYISFTQGYTSDYELPPSDPNYKEVERDKMNYLFNQVTAALQQYQQLGAPPFITSAMNGGTPFSYAKGARVVKSGVVYQSLINNNTDTPPTSNWIDTDPVATLKLAYPIGSWYINRTDSTNPGTLLGFGTWVAITDKFIVARGSTYTSTGGAATVTLSQANLPSSLSGVALNSIFTAWDSGTAPPPGSSNVSIGGQVDGATAVSTSKTFTLQNTGSNSAFSIIPTYQAAYIWERTA